MNLDNSMIMQVQVLPLRCKADSVFPTCRHGNPARKAGRDGGHPATQRESLLAGAYEERTAKTLKTIVILEQRNGLRRCTQNVNGDMGTDGISAPPVAFLPPGGLCPSNGSINGHWERGNRPYPLSHEQAASRMDTGGRIGSEANASL